MPCTQRLSAALVRLLQQQVAFDCALLLGVGVRPVYLYDNLHHQRALLFDRYLTRHFSQDPFMQALEQGLGAGVWTLAQVSRGRLDPEYRHHFYQATGWQEEVGLILPGLDTEAIAGALGIGSGTVKNHRKHLYAKLHLRSRAELFPLLPQSPHHGAAGTPHNDTTPPGRGGVNARARVFNVPWNRYWRLACSSSLPCTCTASEPCLSSATSRESMQVNLISGSPKHQLAGRGIGIGPVPVEVAVEVVAPGLPLGNLIELELQLAGPP
ncbi:UNVERIFIED_CONTAM: hypothetical protein K2H54_000229 [Gekko kuhli]